MRTEIDVLLTGFDDGVTDLGIHDVTVNQLSDGPYPNTIDISIQGTPVAGNRDIPTVGIFRIVTGYGFQSNRGVFHRAGNRADLVHGPRTGHDPIAADPTPTGPQARQAAPGGWPAYRTTGVLSQRRGTQEGGGGGPGTSAGSAGEPVQVPRIAIGAVALRSANGELGEVGFAEDYGSGFLQVRDCRGVLLGEEVSH